jgi:hypothetical protein
MLFSYLNIKNIAEILYNFFENTNNYYVLNDDKLKL